MVGHLKHQFNEITRLKERLDKLEQPELLNEEQKLLQAFPGSQIKKQHDPMPRIKLPKIVTTPAERIKYIADIYGTDSKEWATMLRLKGLTNDQALKLIEVIDEA